MKGLLLNDGGYNFKLKEGDFPVEVEVTHERYTDIVYILGYELISISKLEDDNDEFLPNSEYTFFLGTEVTLID